MWRAACLLGLAIAGGLHAAPEGDAYVELGTGFKSGDFGTAVRSDLFYIAPTAGYLAPRFDLSATVPYLRLTTDGATGATTETGLGDIVGRAGAVLMPDNGDFSMYGALAIKIPTADEDRGLGTGETDLGAFLSARKALGPIQLNVQGGYLTTGLAHMDGLRDAFLYGAGLSAAAGRGRVYASLDGRTALVSGTPSPLEVGVGGLYPLGRRFWVKGSAFAGLNEGGPTFGLGIGLARPL